MNPEITAENTAQPAAEPITRFQCRHIHHTGHRCGSPCLKREEFCYYHHTTRRPVPKGEAQDRIRARKAAFILPRPEDRSAIQQGIGEVLLRLAANELNPRRAGLLLYGLQIASVNLPPRQPDPDPAETVEEVVEHPELGLIAAPADFDKRENRDKNLEEILIEAWDKEQARQKAAQPPEPLPSCIEGLTAAAESPALVVTPPTPNVPMPHSSQHHRDPRSPASVFGSMGWDEWVHPRPRITLPEPEQGPLLWQITCGCVGRHWYQRHFLSKKMTLQDASTPQQQVICFKLAR